MTYRTNDRTVTDGSLDEAINYRIFRSNNLNLFVGTTSDDKSVDHDRNNLHLNYIPPERQKCVLHQCVLVPYVLRILSLLFLYALLI